MLRFNSFFIAILLCTCSCQYINKYKSKPIVDLKLDLVYTTKFQSCDVKKVPEEDKVLYEPFELGDSIARINGKIFQTGTSAVTFVAISPSSYNSLVTKREQMMNGKETLDASLLNYQKMIEDIDIVPICGEPKTASDFDAVNKIISDNRYQDIFVLSKNILDSTWNNYRVFKNSSDLKQRLRQIYASDNQRNILIIVEPESSLDTTKNGISAEPIKGTNNIESNEQIRQILLKTNNFHLLDFSQRKIEVDKVTETYFADNFTINVRFGKSDSPVSKRINDGREYLDQLASNNHLSDIKVVGFKKDSQGKITEINVIEIQKNDIDIQIK